jgi:hypothetical protein
MDQGNSINPKLIMITNPANQTFPVSKVALCQKNMNICPIPAVISPIATYNDEDIFQRSNTLPQRKGWAIALTIIPTVVNRDVSVVESPITTLR